MRDEPVLRLFSDGLLSRWGFDDGDAPGGWWDYLDDKEIDDRGESWPGWHEILIALVRDHMLPALDQRVEVERIGTHHNPIRAKTVNGINVEDQWSKVDADVRLTPEYVEIPMAEVLRVAQGLASAEVRND